MPRLFKNFLLLTLPSVFIFLVLLEFVVFRFILPASDGSTRRPITSSDDVVRHLYEGTKDSSGVWRRGFPPEISTRYSINSQGWNANRDYTQQKTVKTRIAVIGDSYVEAFQVDVNKSFSEMLERDLKDKRNADVEVYRFGYSGVPMSQYLHMMRYVKKMYHPDIFIISIIANDFLPSIYGKGQPFEDILKFDGQGSEWIEVRPQPNAYVLDWRRKLVKKSAIARYLYYNLNLRGRLWWVEYMFLKKDNGRRYQMNVDIDKVISETESIAGLCEHIFSKFKEELDNNTKLLLTMDADREAIYAGEDPSRRESYVLTAIARDSAKKLGLAFLDLTDVFTADYRVNKRSFNFISDGHWNEHGHSVIKNAVSEFIQEKGWL